MGVLLVGVGGGSHLLLGLEGGLELRMCIGVCMWVVGYGQVGKSSKSQVFSTILQILKARGEVGGRALRRSLFPESKIELRSRSVYSALPPPLPSTLYPYTSYPYYTLPLPSCILPSSPPPAAPALPSASAP